MNNLLKHIVASKQENKKLLAILLDPDKVDLQHTQLLIQKINKSPATHIFVGGSHVESTILGKLIQLLKQECNLPIILFPGDYSQISPYANGVLFLNLLSGRNADYLIDQQVRAVPFLRNTTLEVIPTAYLLIESGTVTAVERVSKTKPMSTNKVQFISDTAKAGEFMGNKLIYLEAGSGAQNAIPQAVIREVSRSVSIPLLVGGGIRSKKQIDQAFEAGADLVVIGTAFENNIDFFDN